MIKWRRPFLVGVLVVAIALGFVLRYADGWQWPVAAAVSLALYLGLFVAAVAVRGRRSGELTLRSGDPAFAAPISSATVFSASSSVILFSTLVAQMVGDVGWVTLILCALLLSALAALWRHAWTGIGVRLSPDGIRDRQPLGSLFVPWDAIDPAVSAGQYSVTPHYRRPELVRRRGLGSFLQTSDPPLLAYAIGVYATYPELRPAIGTPAELTRLADMRPG